MGKGNKISSRKINIDNFYQAMKKLKNLMAVFLIGVIHFPIFSQTWSEKMANSVMLYNPTRYGTAWNYVSGTVLAGFIELYKKTGNITYYNYVKNTVDYVINGNGAISGYKLTDYNIDQIREGCAVLYLYNQTGASKYKIAIDTLRKQLLGHPRTSEGGFWHKKIYPYQMWQDGLYMGEPFYAEYSKIFNSSNDFDDISNQIFLMEKHARDIATGLIYHGWDEKKIQNWANPVTGCSANFWGRAMGWYMMSIVDVLDFMPTNYSKRDSVIHVLQRMADALTKVQDTNSGCWYQVLDQGTRTGNYLESSASCMFVYSLLKAVRLGYIDNKYIDVAKKGYQGILDQFIVTNSGNCDITKTCCGAGLSATRDGSYDYYIREAICTNDGKTFGSFILASLEMERIPSSINTVNTSGGNFSISPDQKIIRFTILKPSHVKIGIYSLNAKELAIIKNELLPSGENSETLHVSNLKKGAYIIEFQTENYIESKKIIVTKS
jgi:unsaturated rhamnogalacturonyl hydrolase